MDIWAAQRTQISENFLFMSLICYTSPFVLPFTYILKRFENIALRATTCFLAMQLEIRICLSNRALSCYDSIVNGAILANIKR